MSDKKVEKNRLPLAFDHVRIEHKFMHAKILNILKLLLVELVN